MNIVEYTKLFKSDEGADGKVREIYKWCYMRYLAPLAYFLGLERYFRERICLN